MKRPTPWKINEELNVASPWYGIGGIGYTMRNLSQIKMAVSKTMTSTAGKG